MKRKQLMQFYVEREVIRRRSAPALHHSRFRRRIKCRVYLDQIEMLRIPGQSIAGREFFRIPTLHKPWIRPACSADKNFPAHLFNEIAMSRKTNAFVQAEAFFDLRRLDVQVFSFRGVEQPGSSSGS